MKKLLTSVVFGHPEYGALNSPSRLVTQLGGYNPHKRFSRSSGQCNLLSGVDSLQSLFGLYDGG